MSEREFDMEKTDKIIVTICLKGDFAKAFLARKKDGEPDTSVIRGMIRETAEYKALRKKG
jgi:hypothetical protein